MVRVSGSKAMPCANMDNIAVAVLAGGASSRMGQDKAGLLLPDGQTLLDYMLKKYNNYLVFTSGVGTNRAKSYPEVADLFNSRLGPVAGIISSLIWLVNTHPQVKQCIFIPVDMACLLPEDLLLLIDAKSMLAYFKNSPLPLKVEISANLLQICQNIKEEIQHSKGYSVYKFIQHFKSVTELNKVELQSLTNINYIEDWENFLNEYIIKSGINQS